MGGMEAMLEVLFLFVIVMVNRLAFVYVVNRRLHLSFIRNPILTFVYFLAMTLLIGVLFWSYTVELYRPISILTVLFFLFVLFVLNPWIYKRLKETHNIPKHLSKLYPEQAFLTIDGRFLFSKTGDVIFQQTSLGILVFMLSAMGMPLETLVPLFAFIFALLHFHLFFSMPFLWAMYFAICALAGGFIMPFVLLSIQGGIYYTILLHMFWYVGSGALFGSIETIELKAVKKK